MTKRFKLYDEETLDTHIEDNEDCYSDGTPKSYWFGENEDFCNLFYKLNELSEENEQLKKGMIGVVDRYIKNVECNPPSSARTYGKIKGALINIREDLRNLIGDLE